MDASVPKGAAILLDFIAGFESGGDYDIVFGGHQKGLAKPITKTSIYDLTVLQRVWGGKWGSSAAGRYQIIRGTLLALKESLKLTGKELFDPNMQDRLGYQLLKQRGYAGFISGKTPLTTFARSLAQEFASLPVLAMTSGAHRKVARGETYYAGDRLNRALISPESFEAILKRAQA